MQKKDFEFLAALVEAPSPSGFEQPAAAVFRARLQKVADSCDTNVMGSVHALLKGKDPKGVSVMLAGHIDEIGMMVNYITPEGFIAFAAIGGVDAAVLPGIRVQVHTKDGPILGVMGRKPIHLIEEDERKTITKIDRLFIDVGLSGDEAKKRVRIGDPITFDVGLETFGDGFAVSRAFDDKMGAWIAARVLEEVKKAGGAPGNLTAAATVQEEIGLRGGVTSAWCCDPVVGIAVEVGHATDYPDIDKRKHGEAICGKGPIIARGANINPILFGLIVSAAEKSKAPFQIGAEPRGTGTDANAIQLSKGGKAAGLISIPLRYMHTPTEVLSLGDLDAAVKILTQFVLDLPPETDFTPM
jgi:putative aminopeptidase FrvX